MSPETFKKLEAPEEMTESKDNVAQFETEEIKNTHEVEDCSREQINYLCRVRGDLK
ncbi:hypothetical protein [Methanococcoides sp. AM1]|uniref:hypothetical protein n=1 Tax=Methanococcoides sp. AM1 TaxID=1201011 RepID=UPI0014383CD9|nr:hypothetical protein [Methanococcoides sp. AM1]